MRYVYAMAGALERKPKVGDGDCVALVRFCAHAPNHHMWKEGKKAIDLKGISVMRNGRSRRASYWVSQGDQTGHDPDHTPPRRLDAVLSI